MIFITRDLTFRMEACIKQTHIEVTKQYTQGKILDIADGAACFSGFDSFLSQVVGWGFNTSPKSFKAEIESIERFYKELNHSRVDIELCPFVGNKLANYLSRRGYGVTELNTVSVFDLQQQSIKNQSSHSYPIKTVQDSELDDWARRVAIGFGYPEAQEQFLYYARAKGVTAFAICDEGNIIAGATLAMHGDACDLGVTSTLPAYRGKGMQKDLLTARLNYAREHGLQIATVTTEPGTISDLNIQKSGFRTAYTRIKLTKTMLPE